MRRFQREATLLQQLDHPGVPEVYDHFIEGGMPYLVMEYVTGQTLHEMLPKGACLEPTVALARLRTVAEILAHLHARRPPIIFRDLKPANVIITESGDVKLIDFGIAWSASPAAVLTQAVGTPGYAPPEQYAGGDCDTRMDVYALGATAHRLLTGQDPPAASKRLTTSRLPALRSVEPPLGAGLIQLVEQMMEIHPAHRPQSMQDVVSALSVLAANWA
jgi:serine/threonine protein kinase